MWPNQAKCAVLLTFDFDAELMWKATYPDTPAYQSRGQYGARVGLPRILDLLNLFSLPATFFVPGANAEKYPELVERIDDAGHEIGHHGYLHEYPASLTLDEGREVIRKGIIALEKVTGQQPKGYRSPAWDLSHDSLQLFEEFGFLYDSSLMADDFSPYFLNVFGESTEVVEIPVAWELDDAPYFLFNFHPYRSGLASPSHVFEVWSSEFRAAYEQGGVFTLTMHPQISGRAHRIELLQRLIQYIKGFPGVWFATCSQVAEAWKSSQS
jgi:peptidoglycan/xylan/chitin deacetylase (PgdA/CDA1 family)